MFFVKVQEKFELNVRIIDTPKSVNWSFSKILTVKTNLANISDLKLLANCCIETFNKAVAMAIPCGFSGYSFIACFLYILIKR